MIEHSILFLASLLANTLSALAGGGAGLRAHQCHRGNRNGRKKGGRLGNAVFIEIAKHLFGDIRNVCGKFFAAEFGFPNLDFE